MRVNEKLLIYPLFLFGDESRKQEAVNSRGHRRVELWSGSAGSPGPKREPLSTQMV